MKPITKSVLEDAFKVLESHNLSPTRVWMNKRDFDEIAGKHCERCCGRYNHDLESHPIDDCDMEIARRIMES